MLSAACFLAACWAMTSASMVPLVETPLGPIRGSLLKTWIGKDILAFRAIRYAKPPTGQLRFKAPVPVEPWSEVVDATEDGPVCHQPGAEYFGPPSEDCLYINVYTKELSGSKPVIIFFHPGGWFSMTSRSDWAGPDYLLDQDLVLVTVNYRLGPLGFMSTGDEHAVGNYGMKDQVLAMKWVKYNIAAFGGDPKSVTITGYSAGSTSVMLHMLSPMSKGLFHRGISMSAGVTSNWVIMKNPLELSRKLGDVVSCPTDTTTKQLVQCLRTIPAETLADSYQKMKEWAYDPMLIFAHVIEPLNGNDGESFLIDYPKNLIKSKRFAQTPLILGISENEFDGRGQYFLENDTWLNDINTDFERIAPIAFIYERGTTKSKEFSKKIRGYYLGEEPIKKDNKEFGKIYSDALVIVGQEESAKLFARYSSAPVYFYMTTYKGRFSFEMDQKTNKSLGVAHHDELIYLFQIAKLVPGGFNITDPEAKTVKRFCSFWYNYATIGDPTPNDTDFKWKPMKVDQLQYLEIGEDLSMKSGLPYPERTAVWEMIYPTSETPRLSI